MGHWQNLFPSLYLKASDLKGRDVTVTISRLVIEEVRTERGSDKCVIIYFEETDEKARKTGEPARRLVANKTNCRTISSLYGPETDLWTARQVTLFPTTCSMRGAVTECIRIRSQVPLAAPARKTAPAPAAVSAPDLAPASDLTAPLGAASTASVLTPESATLTVGAPANGNGAHDPNPDLGASDPDAAGGSPFTE